MARAQASKDNNGIRASRVFRFVFSEMVRLQTELNERRISHWHMTDALSWIRMPSGRNRTIGRLANQKLYELAKKTIEKNDKLNGRIAPRYLVEEFKLELAKELENQTDRTPADVVRECVDRVVGRYAGAVKFFVPSVLPEHTLITRFKIGPIQFHRKERIWKEFIQWFDGQERVWLDQYSNELDSYNWIAEVSIAGFDNDKGRERAYLLTELAITGLKILSSDTDALWYGTDAQLRPELRRHSIYRSESSGPMLSWHSDLLGLKSDRTVAAFLSNQRREFLDTLGHFLSGYAERGNFGFIGNRIVSALKWADMANSHLLASQRIICYSNCLETLFVTDDDRKRFQICTRSAQFMSVVDPEQDWVSNASSFYNTRSSLVHGEKSPVDGNMNRDINIGKKITDNCIIGMMYFCVWLLNKYPSDSTPRHLSPFSGKGNFTKAFETELPLFTKDVKDSQIS